MCSMFVNSVFRIIQETEVWAGEMIGMKYFSTHQDPWKTSKKENVNQFRPFKQVVYLMNHS